MAIMTYREAAEHAASVERAGNYLHASALWQDAATYTSKTVNLDWCSLRADVCQRLHRLRKEGGEGGTKKERR